MDCFDHNIPIYIYIYIFLGLTSYMIFMPVLVSFLIKNSFISGIYELHLHKISSSLAGIIKAKGRLEKDFSMQDNIGPAIHYLTIVESRGNNLD